MVLFEYLTVLFFLFDCLIVLFDCLIVLFDCLIVLFDSFVFCLIVLVSWFNFVFVFVFVVSFHFVMVFFDFERNTKICDESLFYTKIFLKKKLVEWNYLDVVLDFGFYS